MSLAKRAGRFFEIGSTGNVGIFAFRNSRSDLQFQRDNAKRITGLTVSTREGDDSVQNLSFTRLAVR